MTSNPPERTRAGWLRSFAGDARGNVALFTAISAIPLIVAAGVAIDVARSSRSQTALQVAVDAAALAVASSGKSSLEGLSDAQKTARKQELEALAKRFLVANYKGGDELAVKVDVTDTDVTVEGTEPFPTTLMSIAGFKTVDLGARATVKLPGGNLEIVLVMDTTGSMRDYNRMTYAKEAATKLMDTVLGKGVSSSSKVKFALVPFSGSVNVGTSNLEWIDTTGRATASRLNFASPTYHNMQGWNDLRYRNASGQVVTLPWNGCVEARLGELALNDTPPSAASPDTLFTPYFAPDEPDSGYGNNYIADGTKKSATDLERLKNNGKYSGKVVDPSNLGNAGPWYNCAASPIVPLTNQRSLIDTGISQMTPRGGTLLAEGMMWAWRVLSPEAPYTTGVSFTDKKWRKVVIFMTDGENDMGTNRVYSMPPSTIGTSYSSYGYGATEPLENNRYGTLSQTGARGKLDEKFLAACTNLKEKADENRDGPPSVVIYTIAFQAPEAGKGILESCASGPNYYLDAANGPQLLAKFEEIGRSLTTLYLSR